MNSKAGLSYFSDVNWFYNPDFNLLNSLEALPAVFLAFTFHYNFFPIIRLLENPTEPRSFRAA